MLESEPSQETQWGSDSKHENGDQIRLTHLGGQFHKVKGRLWQEI